MNYMTSHGAAAVANNYNVLPVAPGEKYPANHTSKGWFPMKDWGRFSKRLPTDLEMNRWAQEDDMSVGMPCGRVVAIDLDITDFDLCDKAGNLVTEHLGNALVRVGKQPKKLLLYRTDEPFAGWRARPLPVEILAQGQQFVAFGKHPEGHDYQWLNGSPADVDYGDLTVVTEAQVRAMAQALEDSMPASIHVSAPLRTPRSTSGTSDMQTNILGVRASFDAVEEAMTYIDNNDTHYDDWIRVGLALKAATGDRGRSMFISFSEQSQKNDPDFTNKTWDSLKPDGRMGAGTIFLMARENGWVPDPELRFHQEDDELSLDVSALLSKARQKQSSAQSEAVYSSTMDSVSDEIIERVLAGLDGHLKELVDYHNILSHKPQPIIAVGCALSVIGTAASRRIVGPGDLSPSLGQLHIGKSGAGKETTITLVEKVFSAAGMAPWIGSNDPKSGAAVVSDLVRFPVRLYCIDESGDWLRSAFSPRSTSSPGKVMKELLGAAKGRWIGQSNAGERGETVVQSPYISMVLPTTIAQFTSAVPADKMADGFLARFLYLPGMTPPADIKVHRGPLPAPPAGLIDFLQKLAGVTMVKGIPVPNLDSAIAPQPYHSMTMSDEAEDIFIDLRRQENDYLRQPGANLSFDAMGTLLQRRAQRTAQVAMLKAISERRWVISAADMTWASDLYALSMRTFRLLFEEGNKATEEVRESEKLLYALASAHDKFDQMLKSGHDFAGDDYAEEHVAAIKEGFVPGAAVRANTGMSNQIFAEATEMATARGTISRIDIRIAGKGGRPKHFYRLSWEVRQMFKAR